MDSLLPRLQISKRFCTVVYHFFFSPFDEKCVLSFKIDFLHRLQRLGCRFFNSNSLRSPAATSTSLPRVAGPNLSFNVFFFKSQTLWWKFEKKRSNRSFWNRFERFFWKNVQIFMKISVRRRVSLPLPWRRWKCLELRPWKFRPAWLSQNFWYFNKIFSSFMNCRSKEVIISLFYLLKKYLFL